MKKTFLFSLTSLFCVAFVNGQADEEGQCFADSYAERIRMEMEESSMETSMHDEELETSCGAEEGMVEETGGEMGETNEPTAYEEEDFEAPHLSFNPIEEEEEDVADTVYEWEHETSFDDTESLWDNFEDETAGTTEEEENFYGEEEVTEGEV